MKNQYEFRFQKLHLSFSHDDDDDDDDDDARYNLLIDNLFVYLFHVREYLKPISLPLITLILKLVILFGKM